jgi:hypothetical protein
MMWLVVFVVVIAISIIALIISRILWEYDFSDWLTPLSACILIISLLIFVGLVGMIAGARQDCLAFEEAKSMCVSSTADAEDLENLGITGAVIELNMWLVNAKASVQEYGAWSIYYGLGVEEMEYISLGGS